MRREPVGRETSAQTDLAMHAEILTWSRSRGLFGGISFEGATLRPDSRENRKLYGRRIWNREILETGVPAPPAGEPFVAMLDRQSPGFAHPIEALSEPGARMVLSERQVRFATGQAAIPASANVALTRVAETLKNNPAWYVRVEGFTDNIGSAQENANLSEQRAQAVKNWLVDHGVGPGRLSARGYGALRPIASNRTGDGRARNRRVEIVRVTAQAPTGD